MAKLRDSIIPFDQFCVEVKNLVFGYSNINPLVIVKLYDNIVERAEEADQMGELLLKTMNNEKENPIVEEDLFTSEEVIERIKDATKGFIYKFFFDRTYNKDKFCLKSHIVGRAVQMINNEDMLGYITNIVEDSSRFVMVDFGDSEGAVKIDIDELIVG